MTSTPVLGADGALAGVLSEKDLMAAMISPDCWQRPLAGVMRPNVICYEENTPVRVIYEFLCRVSIRSDFSGAVHLPDSWVPPHFSPSIPPRHSPCSLIKCGVCVDLCHRYTS